jgi:hypothetical protein
LELLFFIMDHIFSIMFLNRIINLKMLINRIDLMGRTCLKIVRLDLVLYKEDLILSFVGYHRYRCFHRKVNKNLKRGWLVLHRFISNLY